MILYIYIVMEHIKKLFRDTDTDLLELSYDTIKHCDNYQMDGAYSILTPPTLNTNYIVLYIRSKTNNYIDILLTNNDEVIYEGKKKTQFNLQNDSCKYKIKFGDYTIICKRYLGNMVEDYFTNIRDNNDNNDNCDAIKI